MPKPIRLGVRYPAATFGNGTLTQSSRGFSVLRWLFVGGVVVFAFLAGIIVGMQFFDVHRAGAAPDATRPWSEFVTSRLLPPRLRGPAAVALSSVGMKHTNIATTDDNTALRELESGPAQSVAAISEGPITPPTVWGAFSGSDTSAIIFTEPVDDIEVTFFAWIFVDSGDVQRRRDMKMIASNRAGGCDVNAAHRGYSFYVNNWATADGALVLEWQDSRGTGDGCGRLASEPGTIPFGQWVHVGFAFQRDTQIAATENAGKNTHRSQATKALLFLNGELLRESTAQRGRRDIQYGSAALPLTLGISSGDRQFTFAGQMAYPIAATQVLSPRTLAQLYRGTTPQTFVKALDLIGARHSLLMAAVLYTADQSTEVGNAISNTISAASTDGRVRVVELTENVMVNSVVSTGDQKSTAQAPAVESAAPKGDPVSKQLQGPPQGSLNTGPLHAAVPPAAIQRQNVPGTLPEGAFDFSKGGNQWVQHMIRVPAAAASGAISDPSALAAGTFSDDVTLEELAASDELGRQRALQVKAAMVHAWAGYKSRAWGADEVRPRSGTRQDNWAGLGMTLVDSLDTLWIMGMKTEFEEAAAWVASSLSFDKFASVSVFETTIRALGGLLAAYDLSRIPVFLEKARDLGNKLLPAFNTPSGIPKASIVLSTGSTNNPTWTGGSSILAELGTVQVEFRYLSHATGDREYARKVEAVIARMETVRPANGLYPIFISPDSGNPTSSHITFGALGDSFYEYLLKVWLQGGRSEDMYRRMYDTAMEGLTSSLLQRSTPSNLAYVADLENGAVEHKMDHLVCFVPGMLALGAFTSAGTRGEAVAVRDLTNAKALAYTCWQMYERQATGIAPEYVDFVGGNDLRVPERAPFYILRPEAAESLFILHQLTGNPIYREWGWRMFQAIDKYCKAEFGYGAYPDVRDTGRQPDDRMESFFLAETLKYLYMLQSPDHSISLMNYTFNTEAHPLSVFRE